VSLIPLTKGEVTLRLVVFELYKLDRYLAAGFPESDREVKRAVKKILKLADKGLVGRARSVSIGKEVK